MPLSSDRVLLEQCGEPLLTFGLPLAGHLPLSFLQDELLIGGLRLVLVVDGPGHMLPQSDRQMKDKFESIQFWTTTACFFIFLSLLFCNKSLLDGVYLSDSNSPCSSGGTVKRIRRLCLRSGVGFQKVSTVPVFLSLMKISLSCGCKVKISL